MKRLTIRDIAEAAGVSPGAVSFALNDKPGVSDATRERILATATQLGWTPSSAARALSVSRTGNIGFVISRPTRTISSEGFYFGFSCGVAEELSKHQLSLIWRMTSEAEQETQIYREWAQGRHVDAVILLDLVADDPRPPLLDELHLPAVSVGTDPQVGSALTIDDAAAMRRIVTHLADAGFTHPAYVSGIEGFDHTTIRQAAFLRACDDLGLRCAGSYLSDYTEDAGAEITRIIMENTPDVDAIIYDSEMLTIGGVAYLRAQGISTPQQIGFFSWEDSPLCRIVSPSVSALSRNPEDLGRATAAVLVEMLNSEGDAPGSTGTPRIVRTYRTPEVIARDTTRPRR